MAKKFKNFAEIMKKCSKNANFVNFCKKFNMAYFNYHAKIKQKIRAGELTSYYFQNDYNKIGFCLVLCFVDKKYPIREYRFDEYFALIGELYKIKKMGDFFNTEFKHNPKFV